MGKTSPATVPAVFPAQAGLYLVDAIAHEKPENSAAAVTG
jgi:hypothetical protein